MAHSTKYLLPCECGQSIVIEVGQAGQLVTCACGKAQEAPTMRGIRALAPAEAENKQLATTERPVWSPLQGSLFATGVMLLVLAGGAAAYFGRIASQIEVPPPPDETTAFNEYLETAPIDQLYGEYLQVRETGLGEKQLPYHVYVAQVKRNYELRTMAGLGGTAVGLLLIGSAFVFRPAVPPRK